MPKSPRPGMANRLKQAREAAGYERAKDAAHALHVKEQTYYAHENGGNRYSVEFAELYAAKFGVSVEWLFTGREPGVTTKDNVWESGNTAVAPTLGGGNSRGAGPIRIVGRVAAGVFREATLNDDREFPVSPFPPIPGVPIAAQYDLVVEGDSINLFAREGEILRVANLATAGLELRDGQLAIIRRITAGVVETTAKRIYRKGSTWELRHQSDNPRFQGVVTLPENSDEIAIIGIVLFKYEPADPIPLPF